jgi:hypothetical protein
MPRQCRSSPAGIPTPERNSRLRKEKIMKIYLGATGKKEVHDFAEKYGCGWCITPQESRNPPNGTFFLDNGAFSAYKNQTPFDDAAFYRLIKRYPDYDFVVVPDIVAGGLESLDFSLMHVDVIPRPRYLAVQDGMTSQCVRPILEKFDGIFVGGTVPWKMETMRMWSDVAHLHKVKCHVGRIGSLQGYLICNRWGVDSVDGTYPSRNCDVRPIRGFKEQKQLNDYNWFDVGEKYLW